MMPPTNFDDIVSSLSAWHGEADRKDLFRRIANSSQGSWRRH